MAALTIRDESERVKIQKYIRDRVTVSPDGCWIWNLSVSADGYGQGQIDSTKIRVHRASYQAFVGDVTGGLSVLHRCGTPRCCNPDHLYLGDDLQNARDRDNDNTTAKGDRHGSHTHPESVVRGEAHHWAKLDEATVRRIKQLLSQGAGCSRTAMIVGAKRETVKAIQLGRTWRHIR